MTVATSFNRGIARVCVVAAALTLTVALGALTSAASAQTDPYSNCVTTTSATSGLEVQSRSATDPYSNCPPGTAPKVITDSASAGEEDQVLGTRILPFTGATVAGFIVFGLSAMGVGVILARRRRSAEEG